MTLDEKLDKLTIWTAIRIESAQAVIEDPVERDTKVKAILKEAMREADELRDEEKRRKT